MKKIDIAATERRQGSKYPPPHDRQCRERVRHVLGNAAGLTQFGVNLLRLPPGAWSSQRHWHAVEDEFVWVVDGEVVLVSDDGEESLGPGDCAGFKAGESNGHHLQNRSGRDALLLEIGTRDPGDDTDYPDIDMHLKKGGAFTHRDGKPYK
jgi:uncharacterized cupin superfamily protein